MPNPDFFLCCHPGLESVLLRNIPTKGVQGAALQALLRHAVFFCLHLLHRGFGDLATRAVFHGLRPLQ